MRTVTIELYTIGELSPHAQEVAHQNYMRNWYEKRSSEKEFPPMSKDKFLNVLADNGDEFTECGTRY